MNGNEIRKKYQILQHTHTEEGIRRKRNKRGGELRQMHSGETEGESGARVYMRQVCGEGKGGGGEDRWKVGGTVVGETVGVWESIR